MNFAWSHGEIDLVTWIIFIVKGFCEIVLIEVISAATRGSSWVGVKSVMLSIGNATVYLHPGHIFPHCGSVLPWTH